MTGGLRVRCCCVWGGPFREALRRLLTVSLLDLRRCIIDLWRLLTTSAKVPPESPAFGGAEVAAEVPVEGG